MPYIDLSYEGRQLAERTQLDNGKLPHGGYRGIKKFPPSVFSYEKGGEFQERLQQEVARVLEEEELSKYGSSPSWSILLHKGPAYSDESPLMTYDYLSSNKLEQSGNYDMFSRSSSTNKKCAPPLRQNGVMYYRPNRTHQYLSATELKDCAEGEINIKYGRPTRTTLLRARQRSNSAPLIPYDTGREFFHRLEDIRNSGHAISSSEYFQFQSLGEGESLHSYLTGARYNRAHCLDAKSVDHSGLYMPKHNPAFGCFFCGPKGLWYLKELGDGQVSQGQGRVKQGDAKIKVSTSELPAHPVPPPPPRSTSAPSHQILSPSTQFLKTSLSGNSHVVNTRPGRVRAATKRRNLDLNIVGKQLPVNGVKLPSLQSPRKPNSVILEPVYKLDVTHSDQTTELPDNLRVPVIQVKELTIGLPDTTTIISANDRTFGVEGHRVPVPPVVSNIFTVPEVDATSEDSPKPDKNKLGDISAATNPDPNPDLGDLSEDLKVDIINDEGNKSEEIDNDKVETVDIREEGVIKDIGGMSTEKPEEEVILEDALNIDTDEMTVTVKEEKEDEEIEDDIERVDGFSESKVEKTGQGETTVEITASPRETTEAKLSTDVLPSDDVKFFLTEKGVVTATEDVEDDVTDKEEDPML